jgi:putative acetyltransferase
LNIKIDDLTGSEVAALLGEHLQSMALHSPPESIHALNLEGLKKPEITFWSVWEEDQLVAAEHLKSLMQSMVS